MQPHALAVISRDFTVQKSSGWTSLRIPLRLSVPRPTLLLPLCSTDMKHLLLTTLLAATFAFPASAEEHDVVIYGGTCAAVIAAVQAKKMGKTAIIVSPDKHLGGLSSGGLGFTDTGNKAVIGGLSRDFYHRIYLHYQKPEAWQW